MPLRLYLGCRLLQQLPAETVRPLCPFAGQAKAAAGALKSLTNDQLKAWLRTHGCPVGGKKEELIARVNIKLGL